ncbi:Uncharacterised protein [Chlamydia trachomatis]|nr:Uncharacterised protein [Chlamydia trachomatis]
MSRWEGTSVLAVLNIRSNSQDGLSWNSITVHRQTLYLTHNSAYNPLCQVISTIVIVTIDWELANRLVAND